MAESPHTDTSTIAAHVMEAIGRYGLQPTPETYRVWFTYFADSRPDLTRAVRELLDSHAAIDDDTCFSLYERFFGTAQTERQLQHTSHRLSELAQQLIAEVDGVSQGTSRYGHALSEVRDGVQRSTSRAEIERLLGSIIDETGRMHGHMQRLEGALVESSARIQELRQGLQQAWREARTDTLTGLSNRKHFDLAVRTAAAQAVEQGQPVCLALADIDHFKQFDDQHGHAVGDHVLKLVAATLRSNVKGQDLVARYGGEEFALVLPATNLRDAFNLANKLREKVASRQVQLKQSGQLLGRMTISFGVTAYMPQESVTAWIARADAALYQAKRGGRNRVVALPPDPAATAAA